MSSLPESGCCIGRPTKTDTQHLQLKSRPSISIRCLLLSHTIIPTTSTDHLPASLQSPSTNHSKSKMTRLVWKDEADDEMVEHLQGSYKPDGWQLEYAHAIKAFQAKVHELGYQIGAASDCTEAWRRYFVLSLKNLARDLPPNDLDAVQAAIKELKRKDRTHSQGRRRTCRHSMCKFRQRMVMANDLVPKPRTRPSTSPYTSARNSISTPSAPTVFDFDSKLPARLGTTLALLLSIWTPVALRPSRFWCRRRTCSIHVRQPSRTRPIRRER